MEEQTTPEPSPTAEHAEPVLQLTETAAEMVRAGLRREGLVDHALRVEVEAGVVQGFSTPCTSCFASACSRQLDEFRFLQ